MPQSSERRFPTRAMSGTELSRVRTEFRPRPPERISQSPLESRSRHCYAIKWVPVPMFPVIRLERSRSAADASRETNGAVIACWLR
jgi:hypothetical protein